jgi:subtilisin family serine protease
VASVAAGETYGAAKLAELRDVKVFNAPPKVTTCASWVIKGLEAVDNHHQALHEGKFGVVNLSIGGTVDFWDEDHQNVEATDLEDAIKNLPDEILSVAAAGNSGQPASNVIPARMSEVLTVGATELVHDDYWELWFDEPASWSNHGSAVDIWAPGEDVPTSEGDRNGTSFSAPLVAGVAAMHAEFANPEQVTGADVRAAILSEATQISGLAAEPGSPEAFASGLIRRTLPRRSFVFAEVLRAS